MKRMNKNLRLVSLNGGLRRMLSEKQYASLIDNGNPDAKNNDIVYDFHGLQNLNPIKGGTYLSVIYWDGTLLEGSNAIFYRKSGTDDEYHLVMIDNHLEVANSSKSDINTYTKAGYIVVDGTITRIQDTTPDLKQHLAALQLRKAKDGDDISKAMKIGDAYWIYDKDYDKQVQTMLPTEDMMKNFKVVE